VSDAKLDQLEANGVDNWQNYGCMCNYLHEEECDDKCIQIIHTNINKTIYFLNKNIYNFVYNL
jgi:hypothetical protein